MSCDVPPHRGAEDLRNKADTIDDAIIIEDTDGTAVEVVDLRTRIDGENATMTAQLNLLGVGPTPLAIVATRLETLIDFLMNTNEAALAAFETGVSLRFNRELRTKIGSLQAELVVPNGPSVG